MKQINTDVLIVGAGLTGLTMAYLLKDTNLKVKLVESRKRIGGRIKTFTNEDGTTIELGATWLGNQHHKLKALLEELEMDTFEQIMGSRAIYEAMSTSPHYLTELPPNSDPSMRIVGSSSVLIQKLFSYLDPADVHLSQQIENIEETGDTLRVTTADTIFVGKKVVTTVPPNLLANTIKLNPSLPADLSNIAQSTHTWMGESIKIGFAFKTPFWREKGLSGTIFSNVGPITEMYDHSNYADDKYALKGFFNGAFYSATRDERKQLALRQLQKYYGDQVLKYTDYTEAVWMKDKDTFFHYKNHVVPHQNNGHTIYRNSQMRGKLIVAGSETAAIYPGYMEGAIQSAMQAVNMIDL